jgi:dihydrofolate reductase
MGSCRIRHTPFVVGLKEFKEDAMRDLILKMHMSLDGFVAGPDGGIKWVFDTDQEAMAWTVATVSNASLHIMGSRTFHDMAAYWPTSTEVFAPPMNQIPKAVFSKRGPAILGAASTTAALEDARAHAPSAQSAPLQPGGQSWAHAYVASGDLTQEVANLKAREGKPIIAHGGASFARSLIAAGLIDEYALLVYPIALGTGLPVFSGLAAPRSLKLVSSKAFPSGSVAQVYRRLPYSHSMVAGGLPEMS